MERVILEMTLGTLGTFVFGISLMLGSLVHKNTSCT